MKRFFYIALSAILFWTCGEEFQPANPLDPETPDYESPTAIFVASISDGDTLETETVLLDGRAMNWSLLTGTSWTTMFGLHGL